MTFRRSINLVVGLLIIQGMLVRSRPGQTKRPRMLEATKRLIQSEGDSLEEVPRQQEVHQIREVTPQMQAEVQEAVPKHIETEVDSLEEVPKPTETNNDSLEKVPKPSKTEAYAQKVQKPIETKGDSLEEIPKPTESPNNQQYHDNTQRPSSTPTKASQPARTGFPRVSASIQPTTDSLEEVPEATRIPIRVELDSLEEVTRSPEADQIEKVFMAREPDSLDEVTSPSEELIQIPLVEASDPSTMTSAATTNEPFKLASDLPSVLPSFIPSSWPSIGPTKNPSSNPTIIPSSTPSEMPSSIPSIDPSHLPTRRPSTLPSATPSQSPTDEPSQGPSSTPSVYPSASLPQLPSLEPSILPTIAQEAATVLESSIDSVPDSMVYQTLVSTTLSGVSESLNEASLLVVENTIIRFLSDHILEVQDISVFFLKAKVKNQSVEKKTDISTLSIMIHAITVSGRVDERVLNKKISEILRSLSDMIDEEIQEGLVAMSLQVPNARLNETSETDPGPDDGVGMVVIVAGIAFVAILLITLLLGIIIGTRNKRGNNVFDKDIDLMYPTAYSTSISRHGRIKDPWSLSVSRSNSIAGNKSKHSQGKMWGANSKSSKTESALSSGEFISGEGFFTIETGKVQSLSLDIESNISSQSSGPPVAVISTPQAMHSKSAQNQQPSQEEVREEVELVEVTEGLSSTPKVAAIAGNGNRLQQAEMLCQHGTPNATKAKHFALYETSCVLNDLVVSETTSTNDFFARTRSAPGMATRARSGLLTTTSFQLCQAETGKRHDAVRALPTASSLSDSSSRSGLSPRGSQSSYSTSSDDSRSIFCETSDSSSKLFDVSSLQKISSRDSASLCSIGRGSSKQSASQSDTASELDSNDSSYHDSMDRSVVSEASGSSRSSQSQSLPSVFYAISRGSSAPVSHGSKVSSPLRLKTTHSTATNSRDPTLSDHGMQRRSDKVQFISVRCQRLEATGHNAL